MNNNIRIINIITLCMLFLASFGTPAAALDKTQKNHDGISIMTAGPVSNSFLNIYVDEYNEDGAGTYTVATGALHPDSGLSVLYDGDTGDPWSSYNTIRVYNTSTEYITSNDDIGISASSGYTLELLDDYITQDSTVVGNSIVTQWQTDEGLNVTQTVEVQGTKLSDSAVRVTMEVHNPTGDNYTIGIRYLWDLEIAGNDDSLFRQRNPDSPWTDVFQSWSPPAFTLWETVDDANAPTFSVFGSVSEPTTRLPQPTSPDQLMYVYWDDGYDNAFDVTPSGSADDSAVLYYWDPLSVPAGETVNVTAYITTQPEAMGLPPIVNVPALTPVSIGLLAGVLGMLAIVTIRRRL